MKPKQTRYEPFFHLDPENRIFSREADLLVYE